MAEIVFEKNGTNLIVKPDGHIDRIEAPKLLQETNEKLAGISNLTLDFETVDYISSAGIRVLLELYQDMEDKDGSMQIIHVQQKVMTIFKLVNLTEFVTIES